MTLPLFPNFGNFVWSGRQGESVNLRRTADHADHQRKRTVPHVAKSQAQVDRSNHTRRTHAW